MVINMKHKIIIPIAILLLVNTGCEKKEKKEVRETFKSIKYYDEHTDEMFARFKECRERNYIPSEAERKDCKHVYSAHYGYEITHRH